MYCKDIKSFMVLLSVTHICEKLYIYILKFVLQLVIRKLVFNV